MSQSEPEELMIYPRADITISAVAHDFRFPRFWYDRAERARGRIYKADNYEKAYVFSGELDSLGGKLCDFAQKLFTRLVEVANTSGINGPSDWAEEQTRAGIA